MDGFVDWLLLDALWSVTGASAAGRVDCTLLGYRAVATSAVSASGGGRGTKAAPAWCVLSVGIVLSSPTDGPSLSVAAILTAEEPLALRCCAGGAVRALVVLPPVWGPRDAEGEPESEAAENCIEDIGEGTDATDDADAEPKPLDIYSAVELRPTTAAPQQLEVAVVQQLDGYLPLQAPTPQDLRSGAVLACAVQISLAPQLMGAETQQRADPHAQIFEWLEASADGDSGGASGLLRHSGFVGALGYICNARPQRRFVVLSPQRRYACVAESQLVTVFALKGEGGEELGPRPQQQLIEMDPNLGELVGLMMVEAESDGGGGAPLCSSCEPVAGAVGAFAGGCGCGQAAAKSLGALLLLGTTGVSAVQLLAPMPSPATAVDMAAGADESAETQALRLRALELLSSDQEW